MIFGLVSSYEEGRLALSAVRSLLACCDRVLVLDGPVGDTRPSGDASVFWPDRKPPGRLFVKHGGPWESDAAKRTELIRWAQTMEPGPCWGVVLDGDEVMLWPELLPDYIYRSDASGEAGGIKLTLVFEDGQVYETGARVMRIDLIDHYVLSGYQIALKGQQTIWTSPIVPAKSPPMQGQPHILHRGYLRPPNRNAPEQRMSRLEIEALAEFGIRAPAPL